MHTPNDYRVSRFILIRCMYKNKSEYGILYIDK